MPLTHFVCNISDTQITVPVRLLKSVREKIEMYGTDGRFISPHNISDEKAWKELKLKDVDKLFQKYTPTFEQFKAHPEDLLKLSRMLRRNMKS